MIFENRLQFWLGSVLRSTNMTKLLQQKVNPPQLRR
jgi:hypothetical protein